MGTEIPEEYEDIDCDGDGDEDEDEAEVEAGNLWTRELILYERRYGIA
jgi:hypothetical protein